MNIFITKRHREPGEFMGGPDALMGLGLGFGNFGAPTDWLVIAGAGLILLALVELMRQRRSQRPQNSPFTRDASSHDGGALPKSGSGEFSTGLAETAGDHPANRTPVPLRREASRQFTGPSGRVAKDIEELSAELEQFTSRLSADIDQRAARLEGLLRAADQRIAELQRLGGEGLPGSGEKPSSSRQTGPAAGGTTSHDSPLSSGTVSPFASPPSTLAGPAGHTGDLGDDPLSRSVYALADAGHNSIEIARRLREHVGKVELILALRKS